MPDWFSKELHHFTFPPAVGISDFQFLYIFANNYYLRFIQWIVQWYFMVSICILLMTKNINHFFMSLLAICISSLEKHLFRFFSQLRSGLFVFLLLSCESSFVYSGWQTVISICSVVYYCFVTAWTVAHQTPVYGIFQARILESELPFSLTGIFLTQWLNPHLLWFLHCRS